MSNLLNLLYSLTNLQQDAVTGLFSSSTGQQGHAWVRDNVYSCQAVWGLSIAYRNQAEINENKEKAESTEQVRFILILLSFLKRTFSLFIVVFYLLIFYSKLPHTQGTQRNSGYFEILENLRIIQDILTFFKLFLFVDLE